MAPDTTSHLAQFNDGAIIPGETAAQNASTTPSAFPIIPDYELLKQIGHGSYGEVWLARNVFGEFRAVKIVYRHAFEHDRPFEREFEGIRRFEPISRTHPSQLSILHVGRNDKEGYFYYVMELAEDATESPKSEIRDPKEARSQNAHEETFRKAGQDSDVGIASGFGFRNSDLYTPHTLKLDLCRRTRLPVDECIRIGLALTTALEHLHEHGLVHRDIKPSNIIFVNRLPKLADIGLVAAMDKTLSFVGTSGFLPPEGPGTTQGDIYSLGKVLYEMSMGRDRQEFPKLPPDLAKFDEPSRLLELNAIIVKACHHDPRQRYESARAMASDLALLQCGKSVKRKQNAEWRWAIAKKMGLSFAVLVAILLAALFLPRTLSYKKPTNPEAQRLYLQARFLLSRLTDQSVAEAMSNLDLAIKIDRQFVSAYITLFEIYCWNPGGISDSEQAQKVREIANKLLSFDRNLGEGHAALAMSKFDEGDWQGAEAEIQKAIKLKPKYALAHGTCGFISALQGRTREAHRELEEAKRLDPISRIQATVAGFPYLVERNYDAALAQFREANILDENFPLAHMWAGVALEAKGDYVKAIAEYEKFDLGAGGDRAGVTREYQALRQAFQDEGEKGYWRKALELKLAKEAEPNNKMFGNELWELPGIYAQLGAKDEALALLEKDLAVGELSIWLRVKPYYESLRDEERFKALLQTLGTKH